MRKRSLKAVSLMMALCMALGLAGCGPAAGNAVNNANGNTVVPIAGEIQNGEKTGFQGETGHTLDLPEGGGGVSLSGPVQGAAGVNNQQLIANTNNTGTAAEVQDAPRQLTIEDIQAMNPGRTVIDIYNNGYLTTLVGKFYDKPVTNQEEAIESIRGLAVLLGLTKGCEFFIVYKSKDNEGYTYYTYQQRYGGYTLQYATLKIIIDPEGYTAGLTCSFTPNVGTAPMADAISAAEAENIVRQTFPNLSLSYFSDKSVRLAATFNNVVYNCWVVYTNNPDVSAAFDMPYIEHYVSAEGQYLTPIPANSFASSNLEVMNNDHYFENLTAQNVSKTVTMADGSRKTLTVPVSRNSVDGRYYLMDPQRKMAVAQYKDFYYSGAVNFVSSATPDGWTDNNILAYDNYIKAYDFYAERGIKSIDGFGVPVLVTVGYCDEQGNPVDNACFYGINQGWACFAVSDANRYSDCLDVVAHEFTHGVTRESMQGTAYRNETGSINESYSDIMGNICEMISGQTADRDWLIAENSGKVMRDMGDPNSYGQPAYVGDVYYAAPVLNPHISLNDNGGVHGDNSLIGHMAYLLDRAGMSLDEQFSMWSTSIEMLTPLSDYEDLHAILLFSLIINGMLDRYGMTLNKAFADAGLNGNWDDTYLNAAKPGYGRVNIQTDGYISGLPGLVLFANAQGQVVSTAYPDRNGIVSTLLPAGTFIAQLQYLENGANNVSSMNYTGSGWSASGNFGTFDITAGGVISLAPANSGKTQTADGSGGSSGSSGTQTPQTSALQLVSYNGGYFSMLIPQGWKIETAGQFGSFYYKVFDPANTARQFFMYCGLAPFHKSEAARSVLSRYDTTGGMISNGPVLTEPSVKGMLDCWQYCGTYQQRYEGRSAFTPLYSISMVGMTGYTGPYASDRGIETAGVAVCSTENGTQCVLSIASALVDTDWYGYMGGNWYYTAYDTFGVLCPAGEFDALHADLFACIESFSFSDDYVSMSRNSNAPLPDNSARVEGTKYITGVMKSVYQQVR